MNKKLISIVVSVYNEEEALPKFHQELSNVLETQNSQASHDFEIIYINDGSIDNSLQILNHISIEDSKVKVINFSRNFGHEAAMTAGIDYSKGEATIVLDADLQHPPKFIPQMIEKYEEGNHVVKMVREERQDGGFLKGFVSKFFYYFLNSISRFKIEPNASDFFLISKNICQLFKNDFRESTRFLRGFVQIVGFKQTSISFIAPERIAGESKYSIWKLLIQSYYAITSFSTAPLYLGLVIGLIIAVFSFGITVYSVVMNFLGHTPPGYTTLVVLISFLFSIQFILIGFIGIYIRNIVKEMKKRPLYVVESEINLK